MNTVFIKQKIVKSYIAISFILSFSVNVFAQTNNIEKYWYYRHRLVNGFTKIGNQPGESLIAGVRNLYQDNNPPFNIHNHKYLDYGDQTIYLGWYIGVLATEYKLLFDAGKSTEKTLTELYYAIEALYRLDTYSNQYDPGSFNLDGFFIRNDVPRTFADSNNNYNNYNHFNRFVGIHNYAEVNSMDESHDLIYDTASTYEKVRGKEMSQDQVYHLMIGLALTKHFVHDMSMPVKLLNGNIINYNFNFRARQITHLIVSKIKNDNWLIKNPNGEPVYRGGGTVAPFFAYPLAEAANFITGHNYHDAITLAGYCCWQNIQSPQGFEFLIGLALLNKPDNIHMSLALAALSNSWHFNHACLPPQIISPCGSINFPPIIPINSKSTAIIEIGALEEFGSFYSILRQVLYGGPNPFPNSNYNSQLNSAPCVGPWSNTDNWPTGGWASSHRFTHSVDEQNSGQTDFRGVYTGLDYMLLHNLYQIVNPSNNLPQFIDFLDRELNSPTDNFPKHIGMGLYVGTHVTPSTVEAFRSITANNTIQSNANVTYRAGEEIVLKDGFVAHAGSEFRAYIQPFTCNGNDYNAVNPNNPNNPNANENTSKALDALLTEEGLYGMHNKYIEKQKTIDYSGVPINHPLNIENYNNVSSTSSIVQSSESFRLFPNPNNGTFTIYVQTLNEQEQLQLSVMDVYGKQIINQQIVNSVNHQIDLSAYSKGVYYVSVTGSNCYREVKKVLVN